MYDVVAAVVSSVLLSQSSELVLSAVRLLLASKVYARVVQPLAVVSVAAVRRPDVS
ncbi:hypothetical protein ABZY09_35100 [Streptomyces sp. NPDC002928]|uniref:hypothetical protein n=1 Tax=Streptomyces sp. NPDC002928 TaxID=3154440 RepID=UPI0033B7A811